MSVLSAKQYKEKLKLNRHPEGGYYSVFYKSNNQVLPLNRRYSEKNRSAGTSIYFLLEKNDFSAWHKLKSDEIWHYYDGDSQVIIYIIDQNNELKTLILGNPGEDENASFQVVIKAGFWFSAEIQNKSSFALIGCTVSPGFEFEDFELGDRKILAEQYPEHIDLITKFTRTET